MSEGLLDEIEMLEYFLSELRWATGLHDLLNLVSFEKVFPDCIVEKLLLACDQSTMVLFDMINKMVEIHIQINESQTYQVNKHHNQSHYLFRIDNIYIPEVSFSINFVRAVDDVCTCVEIQWMTNIIKMIRRVLTITVILFLLRAGMQTYPIITEGITFQNSTGKGATKEMLDSFIAFANFASVTYRDDVQKNAKFIKYRMDELYGKDYDNFYVVIQIDEAMTYRYFWAQVDSVYATLNGINKLYPKWSYLFTRNYGLKNIAEYSFFGKDQRGKGITKDLLNTIQYFIEEYEITDTCGCEKEMVQGIAQALITQDMFAWSVICDSKGITSALIRTFGDRYLSIRQKNCYYTMYMFI